MKKTLLLIPFIFIGIVLLAQDEPKPVSKKKTTLPGRANDHFLIQLGSANWAGKPDSIQTKGLSRSFNMYFMFDFPFKSDNRFSAAIGAGVGTDNMYFSKTSVGIKDITPTLEF